MQRFLILALALPALACKDARPETPPSSEKARDLEGASVQDHALETNSQLGIGDSRLYEFAGTMDSQNRYTSTVMVTLDTPVDQEADCSGVLLTPRLALTAAHCVCTPRSVTTPTGAQGSAFQGADCAKHVYVTTVLYGAKLIAHYKEESTQKSYRSYHGSVRLHPDFQLLLDEKDSMLSEQGNLAVIVLDVAVQDSIPFMAIPEREAHADQPLITAGYASKSKDDIGGFYGIRYFRKSKVTRLPSSESSSILYEQQGPYLYNGYPGGPCFQEDGQRRWLVGIASTGTGPTLSCTSVFSFKGWLQSELQRSSQPSPQSAPSPTLKR